MNTFSMFVLALAVTGASLIAFVEYAKWYIKRSKRNAKANKKLYIASLKKTQELIDAWDADENEDKLEKHPNMPLVIILMERKKDNLKEMIRNYDYIINK